MSEIAVQSKLELLKSCFPEETAAMVGMCNKLTELEKNWKSLFQGQNEALGRQTAITQCVVEKEGITVKIAVANRALITGLKFREKLFKEVIEQFLDTKIKKLEFASGAVKRVSSAKEASRAYERYAPLTVTEEQVEKETRRLIEFAKDDGLAKIIGKTKAMAEKKAKRKQ